MQSINLSTSQPMPILGLGTFDLRGQGCIEAIKTAHGLGYTHFDTAAMYANHEQIGHALQEANVNRADLFITSKVSRNDLRYDDVLSECNKALRQLQMDYLDLYLIHWPNNNIPLTETFRAFEKLVADDKVKNIGVSNFTVARLKRAMAAADLPITVNQVEYHPYLNQEALLNFCQRNRIALTAYSPIAKGRVMTDSVLQEIGDVHSKTPVQVTLRWLIQKEIIAIPKASSEAHMVSNMDIFDWSLSEDEMQGINAIPERTRLIDPGWADFDEDDAE